MKQQCPYNPTTLSALVVYANHGWIDSMGYSMKQLLMEKSGNSQALVLAEDKHRVDMQYERQLYKGDTYELLYRISLRNGTFWWGIDKGITSTLSYGKRQNESIITEVTAIKERDDRMALLVKTDQLTRLSNKTTFMLLAQTMDKMVHK